MSGFALVWGKMLESSLWVKESKETRLVWIALLVMKDQDGIVQCSVVGLADRAKVSLAECKEALRVLLSPDEDDTSKVLEGRRIVEVPGGWSVVNHDAYRFSTEAKRQYWREQKAKSRAKIKEPPSRDPIASAPPGQAKAVLGQILQKTVEQSPELAAQFGVNPPPQPHLGTTRIED